MFIRENPIKMDDLGEHGWFIMENPTKMDDFFISQLISSIFHEGKLRPRPK